MIILYILFEYCTIYTYIPLSWLDIQIMGYPLVIKHDSLENQNLTSSGMSNCNVWWPDGGTYPFWEFNWGSMKILIYFELNAPTPVPQWLLLIHNSKSHSENAFSILEQYEAVRRFERIHRYDQQKHWIEVYSRSILGPTYSLKRHAVSLARGHVMSLCIYNQSPIQVLQGYRTVPTFAAQSNAWL